jgi:glycosyltransferase family protein
MKLNDRIRKIIPLAIRIRLGPVFAYISYIINLHLVVNRNNPKVLSLEDTISLINSKNLSAIRFGDGEMSLIANQDLGFQNKDEVLSKKLIEVLRVNNQNLLICIPGIWNSIRDFSSRSYWFTLHHLFRYRDNWIKLLNKNQVYGDAFITRPYLNYCENKNSVEVFRKIISLWENKDITLIEGNKSRLGVGNDLFDKVKSLKRILCPPENAFSSYDKIKEEALKVSKDNLILLSLGPTAKVLAYDLFLAGYRVIDIGHIDMEYEMFLKNSREIVKVPYKYFNEIDERNPEECKDEKYLSQIIAKIS